MSMASFIPALVLANAVLRARKQLVAARFCNTTVTIELQDKGNKLTINTLGEVSSADTNEAAPMTYGDISTTGGDLEITMDKTVSIKIKDKEKRQIALAGMSLEDAFAARIIYKLGDDVDQLVMGKYTECTVDNYETGTTPWQWGATAADVPAFFASLNKSMDDAMCETEGRFVVLPNIAIQGIRLYMAGRVTSLGDRAVVAGYVGDMFGMSIHQSPNCVSTASVTHGIAGNLPNVGEGIPGCVALAIQISPVVEKLRLEGYWADGLRARCTGGALVFKPDRCVDVNLNDSLLA